MDAVSCIPLFKDFIEDNKILARISIGKKSVEIKFMEIVEFDPDLGEEILNNSEETMKAFELAFEAMLSDDYKNFKIRITDLPKSCKVLIREIRCEKHYGKMVCIEGRVKTKSKVRPKIISTRFECPSCGNIITILQLEDTLKVPNRCGCGRKGNLRAVSHVRINTFIISMQEVEDQVKAGSDLQNLTCIFNNDLCDLDIEQQIYQGCRVILNGIIKEKQIKQKGLIKNIVDHYLDVNSIQQVEGDFANIIITPEDEKKIKELASRDDCLDILAKSIFAPIYGYENVKEALILSMFGGNTFIYKRLKNRGLIHILLVGDPGCQPAGSKVMLSNGKFKNIEEIKIGDKILSPQKNQKYIYANVINIHKWWCPNIYDVIELNRNKRKLYSCSYNHIIPVYHKVMPREKGIRKPELRFWDYSQYTAESFSKLGKNTKTRKNIGFSSFLIPSFEGRKNCEIEPYSLGVFIGDGHYTYNKYKLKRNQRYYFTRQIGITTADLEVIEEISKFYPIRSMYHSKGKAITYFFKIGGSFFNLLTKYEYKGIKSDKKFIPEEAMYSDSNYRIRLLAGLIDSDGTGDGIRLSFTSKSKKLAEQVLWIVYSLGGRGTLKFVYNKSQSKKIGKYYKVQFYLGKLRLPLLVKRKQKTTTERYISSNRVAIDCKNKKGRYVYGIEIDSPSKWYITNNFMITHNCAKSDMMLLVTKYHPKARYINVAGGAASAVGLTSSVEKDELTGEWTFSAGAIPMMHKGMLMIDEIGELEDSKALQECLEQLRVSVAKANIQATLLAETTVIAACNPISGRFDPFKNIYEQIKMEPPLVNRFDLIFPFKDTRSLDRDTKIAETVLSRHTEGRTLEEKETEITPELMKKWIVYAQQFTPELPNDVQNYMKEKYVTIRNKVEKSEEVNKYMPVPITVRQLQAMIRISQAYSKLKLQKKVNKDMAMYAVKLVISSLELIGMDPETGEIDVQILEGAIKASERSKMATVRKIIYEYCNKSSELMPFEDILRSAEEHGISELEIDELLEKLSKTGEIFQPRRGFWRMM